MRTVASICIGQPSNSALSPGTSGSGGPVCVPTAATLALRFVAREKSGFLKMETKTKYFDELISIFELVRV